MNDRRANDQQCKYGQDQHPDVGLTQTTGILLHITYQGSMIQAARPVLP